MDEPDRRRDVPYPDYTDAAEARAEKLTGSWSDVDPALLDAELGEHLVQLPNGRYGWRVSMPAMMSYWSELARDQSCYRTAGTTTTLVRAKWTSPPYVTDQLIDALQQRLGADFGLLDFECNHMVPNAKPSEVAALIREHFRSADHGAGDGRAGRAGAFAGRGHSAGPGRPPTATSPLSQDFPARASSAGSCEPTPRTCPGTG